MDWMDIIAGLLFIVFPLLGPVLKKLIGTKMEFQQEVQERHQKSIFEEVLEEIRKEQQAMEAQSEDFSNEELEVEQMVEQMQVEPEPPQYVEPIPEFNFYDEAKTTIRSPKKTVRSAILQEEQEKPKEKIDPKKLVLYSEIMEPKYKH
jgi:hypothetical protein